MNEAAEILKTAARGYPEVEEHFPWGESAFKVKGKVFVFMYVAGDEPRPGGPATWAPGTFSVTCKLPESRHMALTLPFASMTGYGLGKSGWVTARFGPADAVPVDLILGWIEESYRAVAPKKVLAAWLALKGA